MLKNRFRWPPSGLKDTTAKGVPSWALRYDRFCPYDETHDDLVLIVAILTILCIHLLAVQ